MPILKGSHPARKMGISKESTQEKRDKQIREPPRVSTGPF